MGRIQLIEIHDQPWFPSALRDQVTDALQLILHLGNFYQPIVDRLRRALQNSGTHQILDLCSGAGGPWLWLYKAFDRSTAKAPGKALDGRESRTVSVCLTDKYPNAPAFRQAQAATRSKIQFRAEPVDVTAVPPNLGGFRTLFASFHHFPPEQARAILRDAIRSSQGIAIFEVPGRHIRTILLTVLVPIADLLVTPFLRPFRWSRLLWTYILPVIPLVLLFDGIVSCLRVYSPSELAELVAGISDGDNFEWEIGEERSGLLPITYLIGWPRQATSSATPDETQIDPVASHPLS
jgi:hypothetical protein